VAGKASRTTFAKLDRERRLREKRAAKAARKIERRERPEPPLTEDLSEPAAPETAGD
jgi:hypothetical protein